ncbi:hypothetical protein ACHAXT_011758 [Thalassiosira profunda]
MSLPPQQRFFSLSGTSTAAPAAPAATPRFVDKPALALLAQAAHNSGGAAPNKSPMNQSTAAPAPDAPALDADAAAPATAQDSGQLQQAFLQGMAAQSNGGVHPAAALFGGAQVNNQAPQLGQLFGSPAAAAPQAAAAQQQPQANSAPQGNNMINRATLDGRHGNGRLPLGGLRFSSSPGGRRSSRPTQVQAGLGGGAFGPGANVGAAAGMGGLAGLQGLAQATQQQPGGAPQNGAANLISQLQQQQQQQVQQQQPVAAPQASPAMGTANGGNATANDLLKLQMEQERHNRMLQMVQADRQERQMLANKEAMKKKAGEANNAAAAAPPAPQPVANLFNPALAAQLGRQPLLAAQLGAAAKLPGLQANLLNGLNLQLAGVPQNEIAAQVGGDPHLSNKLGSARGAAIVPCRARGMPVDHNFKTAYFVVPDGIEHGDELMCSYPACRQAGVKFRYCLHCKVPVAKRNFRNRHRHGVPGGDGASDAEAESSEEEETETCIPCERDEDYDGVKKEHVLILPGAENANSLPPKKKKKKKKTTKVPCRARGMPMAHNFKTAYFHIPANIEHGDETPLLLPQLPERGGQVPLLPPLQGARGEAQLPQSAQARQPRGVGQEEVVPGQVGGEAQGRGRGQASRAPGGDDCRRAPEEDRKPAAVPAEAAGDEGKVSVDTTQDATKVQKWVELLENKPDPEDKEAMASWMMNLMSTTGGKGEAPAAAGEEAEEREESPELAEAKKMSLEPAESPPVEAPAEDSPIDAAPAAVAEKRESTGEESESSAPPKKKFKEMVEQV